ncbi:PKD domain-containing protein [Roseofilum casamattae]|uniref:PKD domain-containing protein n=1 Tax=Roseofilum casamattae BLCC-M143 TaxID=3022442 RepID=A0ABT7BZT6_9CYAN|nr:PKD domain-containing protein [Roseofilum casamattae]MDJ1184719.1 PKD domain-containing protein [Roseofilum casamattae BLCC-M143]
MSILHNCLKAFSLAGAISILNIGMPAIAANTIEVELRPNRSERIDIAELEEFAQTGQLSYELKGILYFPIYQNREIRSYYDERDLEFEDFLNDFQQQLNRPIPTDPNSPVDLREQKLLQVILGNLDENDWKIGSRLISNRVGDKSLINFLKTLPVDTITEDNFVPSLRAYRPTKPVTLLERSPVAPGIGTPLYSSGDDLIIQVLGSDSGFTSALWLMSPSQHSIASNQHTGAVVNLGPIPAGQELKFGLQVYNTGYWYYTGAPSNNPDGISHARVSYLSPGVVRVGFEDLFGGGDFDFDDHTFKFSNINTQPQFLRIGSAPVVRRGDFFDFYALAHDWETLDGLRFSWDFNGDGQTDYEGAEGPIHWNYGKKGIYNSTVTVTDVSGAVAQYGFQTEVVPEPAALGGLALLGMVGLGKLVTRKRKGA